MGRLLLVANPEEYHVGGMFLRSAEDLKIDTHVCDIRRGHHGDSLLRSVVRRARRAVGRSKPGRMRAFGQEVIEACRRFQPSWLLATGVASLSRKDLKDVSALGIPTFNFLTDDPWNPSLRARWFLEALPAYDAVFNPRRSNLAELRRLGCRRVVRLPFAYDPWLHHPVDDGAAIIESDVLFVGGADADRVPYVRALSEAGFDLALYGGRWERYGWARGVARGIADPETTRRAVAGARITLCLVRRANRDGHCMRTFEAPAMKACMLMEDTEEHRELFGGDRSAVLYFREPHDMLERASELLEDRHLREQLRVAGFERITGHGHTYTDRLRVILGLE